MFIMQAAMHNKNKNNNLHISTQSNIQWNMKPVSMLGLQPDSDISWAYLGPKVDCITSHRARVVRGRLSLFRYVESHTVGAFTCARTHYYYCTFILQRSTFSSSQQRLVRLRGGLPGPKSEDFTLPIPSPTLPLHPTEDIYTPMAQISVSVLGVKFIK